MGRSQPATCNPQLVTRNPQLLACNLFSALQLVIGLSVENEEFFVVVSRISAEG